jgi:hypothetical protein
MAAENPEFDIDEGATEEVSVTETFQGYKISVTFERKVSDGDYGSVTARAWAESEIPRGATSTDVATALGRVFAATKVAVLDELGRSYTLDENFIVREDAAPVTEARVTQAFKSEGATQSSGGSVRVVGTQHQPLPDWLISDALKAGVEAVFDNTPDAVGTTKPWYREAVSKGAQGHGKDGTPKAFWPPKK